MSSILDANKINFNELEQNIFRFVCGIAQEMTRSILEDYDDELSRERDKEAYRDKGKRKTSIKTVYGEVSYERRVYRKKADDGTVSHVFLLDEEIGMDRIGLISTNLVFTPAEAEELRRRIEDIEKGNAIQHDMIEV